MMYNQPFWNRCMSLIWILALLAVGAVTVPHAVAQARSGEELEQLLGGLHQGMDALRRIGGQDHLVEELQEVAAQVRRQLESRAIPEREVGRRHLEIKRWALEAIKDSGRTDAAGLMARAVRATEVALEGRQDEEAQAVREREPDLGAQTELLLWAGRMLKEQGKADRAAACTELGMHYQKQYEKQHARHKRPEMEEAAEHPEIRVARRDLRAKKWAHEALEGAGRKDAAEAARRMWQAAAVRLEGSEGEEAKVVLEREPRLGAQIELLQAASGLFQEQGAPDRAQACTELAETYARKLRRRSEADPAAARKNALEERIEELERRVKRVERALERRREPR